MSILIKFSTIVGSHENIKTASYKFKFYNLNKILPKLETGDVLKDLFSLCLVQ